MINRWKAGQETLTQFNWLQITDFVPDYLTGLRDAQIQWHSKAYIMYTLYNKVIVYNQHLEDRTFQCNN